VGIAVALVATAAWIVAACDSGGFEVCDPSGWPGGAQSGAFIAACCSPSYFDGGIVTWPYCPNYDGPDAAHDGDAMNEADGGDASTTGPIDGSCAGECVPLPPTGWSWPSLVWIGAEDAAPPCPPLLEVRYEGHGELDAAAGCACQCEPPARVCALPAITANAATCAMADGGTPYDLPAAWDGGCAVGDPCDGGGPCVGSVTIAPLLGDASCAPVDPDPTPPPATWGQFAIACQGVPPGGCDNDWLCAPPPAPGFLRCVSLMGTYDCSEPFFAPYTKPYVFYEDLQDTRTCSPCGCGAPSDTSCTATIAIFSDGTCTSAAIDAGSIGTASPVCVDVGAGVAPGVALAVQPEVKSACEPSGGDAGGAAVGLGAMTFCCIPQP
jgi:hypothetical protein